ncbi:MAG: 30S ribosomal protein S6 [Candidatus Kapabacteria bacterium]|jgi:small subunit ribosomal protein S6|nr:30S ribosomal protein S6 [Candidatus Kapabacteria bacterium]
MSVRRLYETTYILNAALEDAEIDAAAQKVTDFVTENGGTIVEINKWGRRRLAYPIRKKYNGYYVYMAYEANADAIPPFERSLILDEHVLRHLTVNVDPKLREFRKVRAEAQAQRAAQMAEQGITQPERRGRFDGPREPREPREQREPRDQSTQSQN